MLFWTIVLFYCAIECINDVSIFFFFMFRCVSFAILQTEQPYWLLKFSVCFASYFRYYAVLGTTVIEAICFLSVKKQLSFY